MIQIISVFKYVGYIKVEPDPNFVNAVHESNPVLEFLKNLWGLETD